jgi:hypothetical protein
MIKYTFDESCFLDLEDNQGQMIGHTPHDILKHIYTANVEEEDHDSEIIVIKKRMRQEYDPNEQPQEQGITNMSNSTTTPIGRLSRKDIDLNGNESISEANGSKRCSRLMERERSKRKNMDTIQIILWKRN